MKTCLSFYKIDYFYGAIKTAGIFVNKSSFYGN